MPVAWSIALSIRSACPPPAASCRRRHRRAPPAAPCACCSRISSRISCGSVKLTKIGLTWAIVTSRCCHSHARVADVDEPRAEAAVDRRADIGVAEVELAVSICASSPLIAACSCGDQRLLLVIALPGLDSRSRSAGHSASRSSWALASCASSFCLAACACRAPPDRAAGRSATAVAGLDLLALVEVDLDDLAVDPALDRDHVVGLHRADAVEEDRHIGRRDRAGGYRDARLDGRRRRGFVGRMRRRSR